MAAQIHGALRVTASRLARVEAERALLRLRLEAPGTERAVAGLARTLDDLWDRIDCLEITEEICALAGRIAPASRLRTLDAIHLATFHQLRRTDPGMRMLTFDERLLRELLV